jgi:hypothetical protein
LNKRELKAISNEVAVSIYKDVVNHDPLNMRLIYIKQHMSPLIKTIKVQQKEIEHLEKRYVEVLSESTNRLEKLIEIQHLLDK